MFCFRFAAPCLIALGWLLAPTGSALAEVPVVDQWRYRLQPPAARWPQPDFDAGSWQAGPGGFGTRGTPGARIGTIWRGNNIWLRKDYTLDSMPAKPGLLIHHDEDAEVFLNGQRVARREGWTTEYQVVPLDATAQ